MPSTNFHKFVTDEDKGIEDLFTMDDDKSDGGDFGMPPVITEEEPGCVIIEPLSKLDDRNPIGDNLTLGEGMYEEGSDDQEGDLLGWDEAYEQEV